MVTVNADQATLTEAIEQGSLSEEITLTEDQVVAHAVQHRDGFSASQRLAGGVGLVLHSLITNSMTPINQRHEMRLAGPGSFSFVPTIGFDIEISGFSLQKLTFEIRFRSTSLSIRVSASTEHLRRNGSPRSIRLTPITFSIGRHQSCSFRIVFRVGVRWDGDG
ncbi:MAG: hypothetical protein R3E58_07035 [Phycisphaerae bacterium]